MCSSDLGNLLGGIGCAMDVCKVLTVGINVRQVVQFAQNVSEITTSCFALSATELVLAIKADRVKEVPHRLRLVIARRQSTA